VKVIAFYLPQFHEIEENNKWWGKGFTEWVNVKKSKPLFKGHDQPREPLNNNYYNLLEVDTLRWQAELAQQYGVYGFCFYHYWFNGKQLLQKPMELLLENKDIQLPFCISWANEPWTRSWDGKAKEVLMPQEYGDENDWKVHFDYLLNFFKDDRYIKVDGKPKFLIYKSSSITRCDEMMEYWDHLARENGFKGMYFVQTLRGRETEKRQLPFSSAVEFEPAYTLNRESKMKLNFRRIYRYLSIFISKAIKKDMLLNIPYDYDKVFKRVISNSPIKDVPTIPGLFVNWDNSPRRGTSATIFNSFSVEKFEYYLKEKVQKGRSEYKSDYIYINAWNEWAEGTYLEPDERYKFSYLEAVKNAIDS
jgi:thiol-disulfide isomerase/thioredoxin